MPKIVLISIFLLIFVACSNNNQNIQETNTTNTSATASQSTPALQTNQQNSIENNQTTQIHQSKNITLSNCIDENIQANNTTKPTLSTLNCASLTSKDFTLLSSLPALTSLTIVQTSLNTQDITNIANNINQKELITLILENNNLTKSSIDQLDPNFSYSNRHYTSLQTLSLKNNNIEGLLVVDYFPNLTSLDLSGNVYKSNRLHHVGFINGLKNLFIGNNPNITSLDNLKDSPKAEASVEYIDIRGLDNLRDITELERFQSLKTLVIDSTQEVKLGDTLVRLRQQGVEIKMIQ